MIPPSVAPSGGPLAAEAVRGGTELPPDPSREAGIEPAPMRFLETVALPMSYTPIGTDVRNRTCTGFEKADLRQQSHQYETRSIGLRGWPRGRLLAGLEVVFIVIAVGAARGLLVPASVGASAACLLVAGARSMVDCRIRNRDREDRCAGPSSLAPSGARLPL
jgi:hypothetical protein